MTRSILSGAFGTLLLLSCSVAAEAAPSAPAVRVAEAARPIQTAAAIERDADAACSRTRRRLWIDGEGWVVRRITICR